MQIHGPSVSATSSCTKCTSVQMGRGLGARGNAHNMKEEKCCVCKHSKPFLWYNKLWHRWIYNMEVTGQKKKKSSSEASSTRFTCSKTRTYTIQEKEALCVQSLLRESTHRTGAEKSKICQWFKAVVKLWWFRDFLVKNGVLSLSAGHWPLRIVEMSSLLFVTCNTHDEKSMSS